MKLGTTVPLGEGAMGRVLRAFDEELQRDVALKILRSDDPDAVARFLREARAQARVEHPNVAKVFEVGYRDERPCIIMQLVEGRPLDEALDGRPLEEKVRVLRTVARAVHAAHEVGLIHRDLKPTNILVEERDGQLVPFVLDFGIARTLEESDVTVTGQALGTPGYMSPEQARGDLDALDRRSDVFSLGAVLYEVLADRKPFAAASQLESLVKVIHGEAPALSRVAPHLPLDLRAVVERCLEKRRSRRYDSARALADDLDRWLRGEPVAARPVTRTARWLRTARRHPVATTLVSAALLVAVALGVWAWITEARAARRAAYARDLGQTLERLESSLRLDHLAPPHDIRPSEARIEAEIEAIAARAEGLPSSFQGPALYARARGLMALDRWQEALPLLERVAEEGPDDPAVRVALGRVLSERYRQEVEASQRIEDPALRRAAVAEAREAYAARAEEELRRAGARTGARTGATSGLAAGAGLRPHESIYLEGLLALVVDDLETATLAGAEASSLEPWFYEGDLLRTEALLARARDALSRGDAEEALADLARAREAASRAREVGRSDPAAAATLCRVWSRELEARVVALVSAADEAYGQAVEACEAALVLDADHAPALALLADVGWRMADAKVKSGRDPRPELEAAAAAARRGLEKADDPRLLVHLGKIYWVWGNWLRDQGGEAEARYRQALEVMGKAVEMRPGDAFSWLSLGEAWTQFGYVKSFAGEDPLPAWREALDAYEKGLAAPGAFEVRLADAKCGLLSYWGYHLYERGGDPGAYYEDSVASCRRALAIDPEDLQARSNLALALWSVALWEARQGFDAEPRFAVARDAFVELLQRDRDRVTAQLNLMSLRLDWAQSRLDRGASASDVLDGGDAHLDSVLRAYPVEGAAVHARLLLLRARETARSGRPAADLFARAVQRAREAHPDVASVFTGEVLAESLRHRAEYLAAEGSIREAVEGARDGVRVAGEVVETDPRLTNAWRARHALETLLAEHAAQADERRRWRRAAEESAHRLEELEGPSDAAAGSEAPTG